jgi:hypothetical protein
VQISNKGAGVMKMQKIVAGFIGIVASLIIGVSTASAEVFCHSATIEEIIINPVYETDTVSKYAILLQCKDVNTLWTGTGIIRYVLTSDVGTAGYAMLLTAMATGRDVHFFAQSKAKDSLITRLQIVK